MKNVSALLAATLLTFTAFAQTIETVKITVTENSNLVAQDPVTSLVEFSTGGYDYLDNGDQNTALSHSGIGNYAMPFTVTTTGETVTAVDSRTLLDRYHVVSVGFQSKDSSNIKVLFTTSSSDPLDSTYHPAYMWLEHVPTGEFWSVLEDTLKLHIVANMNYQADYRLHIGPAIKKVVTNESCYGTGDGSIKVINANESNWELFVYDAMANLLLNTNVLNSDTLLQNLASEPYIVVTHINGITIDSSEIRVEGPAPLVPSFEIDNYYPTTGDVVSFSNVSIGGISFFWTFGDGNIDSLENVTHQFQNPGAYEVVMVAFNEFGCSESVYDSVWVTAASLAYNGPQNGHGNPLHRNELPENNNSSSREASITAGSQKVVVSLSTETPSTINVMTVNGQVVSSTQSNGSLTEISVTPGVYLVQVVSAKGEAQAKTVFVGE